MEISEKRMVEIVKDFLDISITHDTLNWSNVDCRIYNECTSDGYDVFVVTEHQDTPIIAEDVFYYDHQLGEELKERIRYGVKSFYIEEYLYDDCYMEDSLCELFHSNAEDIVQYQQDNPGVNLITTTELNEIIEEYGIEEEEEVKPF